MNDKLICIILFLLTLQCKAQYKNVSNNGFTVTSINDTLFINNSDLNYSINYSFPYFSHTNSQEESWVNKFLYQELIKHNFLDFLESDNGKIYNSLLDKLRTVRCSLSANSYEETDLSSEIEIYYETTYCSDSIYSVNIFKSTYNLAGYSQIFVNVNLDLDKKKIIASKDVFVKDTIQFLQQINKKANKFILEDLDYYRILKEEDRLDYVKRSLFTTIPIAFSICNDETTNKTGVVFYFPKTWGNEQDTCLEVFFSFEELKRFMSDNFIK